MLEWGERREAVECSLGESFRNWITFTSLEWAGTDPRRTQGWQVTPEPFRFLKNTP